MTIDVMTLLKTYIRPLTSTTCLPSPKADDTICNWTLKSLLLAICLKCVGLLCQSWYVLNIELDKCTKCDQLIVAMGNVLENSLTIVANETFREIFQLETNQNQDDGRVNRMDALMSNDFTIEHQVHVHIGLWLVSFCTQGMAACGRIDLSTASVVLRYMQPFEDILGSISDSRPFLLLSILCRLLAFIVARVSATTPTSQGVKLSIMAELISGLLALTSVVIAGIPYLTSVNSFHVFSPSLPWALICTTLSGYFELMTAYQVWKKYKMRKIKNSLQYWSFRHPEFI